MTLYLVLFLAGILTILLPCILPLIPVVVGVSITGRSKFRPLLTVTGMVISFVAFTFFLHVVLLQFVVLADLIRIGTYAVLFLFGVGFLSDSRVIRLTGAALGALFFLPKGLPTTLIAIIVSMLTMEIASFVASRVQQIGLETQNKARSEFGSDAPITALLIGMTLGLVWVPCAGPALGFALTLVREQPGSMALGALLAYALGTAVPLLIVGYGGQYAVHSVRSIARYSGWIKRTTGVLLILTALGLHFHVFEKLQIWFLDNTNFGDLGARLEEKLFAGEEKDEIEGSSISSIPSISSDSPAMLPTLPKLIRAPEFIGLGPWHNSEPFTLASQKGKVVLVDFWTYSCINCIRTLPHIQGYWEDYKDTGKFVLLGVHTPEFVFEKDQKNVADAIKRHGLTYPTAQDNDFGTWSAFANRYWPAKYLIDAEGYVRYTHFGEGDYEETERAIQSLLQEIDIAVSDQRLAISEDEKSGSGPITPETYLGSRSWSAFGNAEGEPSEETVTYKAPVSLTLNKYYLVGDWRVVMNEAQRLESDRGEIRMKFLGGEINIVLGMGDGKGTLEAEVIVDGKSQKKFTINAYDSYNLFTGEYGEHEVVLKLKGKGVEGYAFTFGR